MSVRDRNLLGGSRANGTIFWWTAVYHPNY